jgi:hypothetical protein
LRHPVAASLASSFEAHSDCCLDFACCIYNFLGTPTGRRLSIWLKFPFFPFFFFKNLYPGAAIPADAEVLQAVAY